MRVNFTVNGRPQEADDVWEGESLLYVLRERLGLPGSKNACEQGECGSCTVRLDGVPVCSCLVAAGQVEGREVVTVEGLAEFAKERSEHAGCASGACGTSLDAAKKWEAKPGQDSQTGEGVELSPIQQAFIDAGAVQCGFCTPGLLVAADEMLERNPSPTDADIREALSGNLCRCTGYEKILDAVRLAAARQERQGEAV
ncbi:MULTISPECIES: (2Fe-2S)-binding protein [Streptomyces]|uniref:Xanthine dehydrogenase iron-sulfur subunit n=1 Tax=Streptomyces venezuelae (strain ATCC 10712 / CBS 650.69 / DSM 40230 / JCM 4526 / NBRC 13096 / PD 04745) TaxID=953739 RepID=F2RB20_STRVP|nr:(2Fe-2S)-binding protein [Streptomyces venezuelae]APE24750.1 oxidoreductase [Streptomyces venezuelae]QES02099.1 (2Fe-2S)-binding protein [Streptomyces venezuelae ATCC 10712]QES09078.1 (2Fe-2S)-binding protein [Streptomyces venezuelae]QES12266.1 (2Fe-2S)-binding protein [Streptomyces venezuelae]CCA59239.1 Xanthine dehydrogenase iron-sulfur subunit [Streptomyces venezuelae ATCC 10712]